MDKPLLIMMVGLPASGKSYFAKKISLGSTIYSSDDIRSEIFGDEDCQDKNEEVFKLLHNRIKESLRSGINTIYDATNINYKRRMSFLNEIRKINCYKVCYLIATPYEDCVRQNAERERSVPIEVITRMYKNIYIPQKYEGWDYIDIIWNNSKKYNLSDLFDKLFKVNQDNPHHTLTVGEHCLKCYYNILDKIDCNQHSLMMAALLHDIGKPFTKSFTNSKGELSIEAHYYQHHLVSAYDSLFYTLPLPSLEIANYIQWHMQPFFTESEKQKNKYKNLWGEDFYNNIMILHDADMSAK